jgi:hypothetical protein
VLDALERYARPLLLIVPGLMLIGALLAVFGLLFLGWIAYGLGLVGLLLGLPALAAVYRSSMNVYSWLSLFVAFAGAAVSVVVAVVMLDFLAADPWSPEWYMPHEVAELGWVGGALLWLGLGLFGLTAFYARTVSRGAAATLFVAGIVGLLAEVAVLDLPAWGLAVVLATLALVWLAPVPERRPRLFDRAVSDEG